MLMWILTVLAIIAEVEGFSNGNFPQACGSMLVQHKGSGGLMKPQNSEPPYEIHVSRHPIRGHPITVILKATQPPGYFTGFMLEARNTTNDNHAVGTFTVDGTSTTRLTCNGLEGSAASNRRNNRKSEIQVTWTSNGNDHEIFFRATFLQKFNIFWKPMDTDVISLTTTPQPSTAPSTTQPSTEPITTQPSTEPITTQPSTEPITTQLSTEPSTTQPSTEPITTQPSTEASTTQPSTEPITTQPSTEASTTQPSTEPITTQPSTEPITTQPSTEPSTTDTIGQNTDATDPNPTDTTEPDTASPTEQSTTVITGGISTSIPPDDGNYSIYKIVGGMRCVDLVVKHVKMGKSQIVTLAHPNSAYSYHLNKVSKICFGLLCMALEILTLIILCLGDPNVTLIALVGVAIGVNFIELLIYCLPIGRTHELKDIGDIAGEVCTVLHNIFTIAFIFVVVTEVPLGVMAGYTAWIFLCVIIYFLNIHRRPVLWKRRTAENSTPSEQWRGQQGKETSTVTKQLSAAGVAAIIALLVFIAGSIAFSVAIMSLS